MPRLPEPVNPAASPWHLLGANLRHWRDQVRGLDLREAAKAAYIDYSQLAKWERGERRPSPEVVANLDRVYEAGGALIALHDVVAAADTQPQPFTPSPTLADAEHMDQQRRHLLQSFAVLGVAGALPLDAVEKVRHAVTATVGGTHLGDWEETVWEYAHTLLRLPPADVLGDLALDADALQRVLLRHPGGDERAWARVNGRMGFLMAQCLGFLGQTREARHWWQTARHAAELAEDAELQAAVLGYEAAQAVYAGRPDAVVFQRANLALAIARGRAWPGAAEAQGARAQTAALAGDSRTALEALDVLEGIVEQLPDRIVSDTTTAFGWPRTRLLHTRSFVLSRVGTLRDAERAQAEAVAAYPAWRVRQISQVQLHRAAIAVRHGDVVAGLDYARDVLARLPAEHHTMFVRGAATGVLEAVPLQEASRPPVIEYRELLALPPSR